MKASLNISYIKQNKNIAISLVIFFTCIYTRLYIFDLKRICSKGNTAA